MRWFGSHSPLWLDTLVRCSGIHNFLSSAHTFTPFERHFLSNGLRFICTPPSSHLPVYAQQFFDDSTRGLQRFSRTLTQRLLFDRSVEAVPYLSKFAVKSAHSQRSSEYFEDQARPEQWRSFELLDNYRRRTEDLLRRSTTLDHHRSLVQHQRRNHTSADASFLQRLMTDSSITIKPADKNLGMVLVDTDWYVRELTRMLQDRITYEPFKKSRVVKGKTTPFTFLQLQTELLTYFGKTLTRHKSSLTIWNPHYADAVFKYLKKAVTAATCMLPSIYLLIKVHKASGLCGRPIVPSTRWLTTPASVVVDHLLQEIVRAARIPHIVKDTKSFVVELEQTILPTRDGIFVTADIASLYTNIDTDMGLRLVRQFLVEQNVSSIHSDLIMDLLTFVMRNSYLQFRDLILHQIDGTAMGTAAAPTYANIVVYMLEKQTIREMSANNSLHLYRRFLDDVFAYLEPNAVDEFKYRMNHLHPKLRFDFVVHSSEAAFLDLLIHKGPRFSSHCIFDLNVHQKKMNLYLYIPYHSFHSDAMKRSFIQTELMRYIRNSSQRDGYSQLKQIFYQRLRDRGYPSFFLLPIFDSIFYADRCFFLWPSATLHLHPLLHSQPPQSACLQRRLSRWKLSQSSLASPSSHQPPPVFIIPYSPLSRLVPTRSLLCKHWDLIHEALDSSIPKPIIAYQSSPSLLKTLVYQRARNMERSQVVAAPAAAPAAQLSLRRYFTAAPPPTHSSILPH